MEKMKFEELLPAQSSGWCETWCILNVYFLLWKINADSIYVS